MRAVSALAALLALAGCAHPKQLFVDGAWVRLAAVPANPAAAYFTVHGGEAPATLIDVSTDTAIGATMHRSTTGGGMAGMAPVQRVEIPARGIVHFAPGGLHVMLTNVNPGIKPGATMHFTFAFADGTHILQDAGVIAAGDPAPK